MPKRRNIFHLYLKYSKKIKNFLLSEQAKKFLIFFIFFLIAGGFWMLQTLNNDYEIEFTIPVHLKEVPNDVIITSAPAQEIRIRIKDKGTALLNYTLGKQFIPVSLNFNDYKTPQEHIVIAASALKKQITSQLKTSSQIQYIKPDTLEYVYSMGKSKMVPVLYNGKIIAEYQHYISDTIITPDSVLVYAPIALFDSIKSASTQYVEISGSSDTIRQHVSLMSVNGIKFIPNAVDITLPLDIYAEKTVEVPLHGINFPPGLMLRTFPPKVQVTFQVGTKHFQKIKANDFAINIPYEQLIKSDVEKYEVSLSSKPEEISNIRISPTHVDFLIEKVAPNDN